MADENKDQKQQGEGEGQQAAADDQQQGEGQQQQQQAQGDDGGDVKDSHGQPGINKERHDREMAEKDKQIAELQAQLEEKSKTEEGRAELKKELEDAKASIADMKVSHKLELLGCKNVKAAKALLEDYDNDPVKLKEGEPYLFGEDEEPKKKGTTGKKPAGPPDSAEERTRKAREAAGLKPKE